MPVNPISFIGHINQSEAFATLRRSAIVGAIAAAGIILADAPKWLEAVTPLGTAVLMGLWQTHQYLKQGLEIKEVTEQPED